MTLSSVITNPNSSTAGGRHRSSSAAVRTDLEAVPHRAAHAILAVDFAHVDTVLRRLYVLIVI
jgi:hypothetical protein